MRMDERGMKVVRVKRTRLLQRLKENKEKHAREFQEAWAGYVITVRDAANALLERALRWGDNPTAPHEFGDAPTAPVNHEEDYDRAIAAAEWSTEDELVLSADDFARYVLDKWEWAEHFKLLNSGYSSKAR